MIAVWIFPGVEMVACVVASSLLLIGWGRRRDDAGGLIAYTRKRVVEAAGRRA